MCPGDTGVEMSAGDRRRRATEEEPRLDHQLLALGKLGHDLTQPHVIEVGRRAVIERTTRIDRIET